MYRSGSTLQFQITAAIVENAGLGKRIEWVKPKRFKEIRKKYANYDDLKVFKSHVCTDAMVSEFINHDAMGIYVFRDLRDVVVSMMQKESKTFNEIWNSGFLEICLVNFQRWTNLPRVLLSKYEEIIKDLPGEVKRISNHLGIFMDKSKFNQIALDYSIDKQQTRIKEFKTELSQKQKNFKRHVFSPYSLLHLNHLGSGKVGRWKNILTSAQVVLIEEKARSWLLSNGYKLVSI